MQILIEGQLYSPNRIFCIGKNYDEHIKELQGNKPEEPIVFMKPVSSIVPPGKTLNRPRHGQVLHHEVEVVLLIGKAGQNIPDSQALTYIAGFTLGLDLTLRDVQGRLKKSGLPWELSKSFEHSAPLGQFKSFDSETINLDNLQFSCSVNGDLRQNGNTCDMLFPVRRLIHELSRWWSLKPGDIIFTGTPAGVGSLVVGDTVEIESSATGLFRWTLSS